VAIWKQCCVELEAQMSEEACLADDDTVQHCL